MKKQTVYGKRVSPLLIQYTDLLKKQKSALEIGCAYGASSAYLASLGLTVDAIDKDLPLSVQETERVRFREIDVREFDFGRKYDIVFAFYSLQYLSKKDQKVILDKMYDSLFKNGILLIKSFTTEDPSLEQNNVPSAFAPEELLKWAKKKKMEIVLYREYCELDKKDQFGPSRHALVELVAKKI